MVKAQSNTVKTVTPASKSDKPTKVKIVGYPGIGRKDGSYPFKGVPADYDPSLHKKLAKKDFDGKASFLEYQSVVTRHRGTAILAKADLLTARAKTVRETGDGKTQKKAKKLKKIRDQMAALEAELKAEGVDTDHLSL